MDEETKTAQENELNRFLKEQIVRNKRAARTTWIIGGIVVVLVTCYMSGLVVLVRGILEPMTAARMIGQYIEQQLPSILSGTENALQQQATPLGNALSDRIITSLPKLREEAEKQIDLTCEQFLPLLREEIRSTVRCYMEEHADEISDFYGAHKGEEFAEFFIDSIMVEVADSLNKQLREVSGEYDLDYIRSASLTILNDINGELSRLLNLSAEEMTKSDRLQRRLIVAWVQALDELLRSRRVGEIPAVK